MLEAELTAGRLDLAAALKVVLLYLWDTRSTWPPHVVPVAAANESDRAATGGD